MPPDALLEVLGRAVAEANREVARRADGDPARRGMGTTLTAMLFSGDCAALAHIGDSRAFRLRDGQLRQITDVGAVIAASSSGAASDVLGLDPQWNGHGR